MDRIITLLGKTCRRSPRKLHRLRTAKPASDHAEIEKMIATRAAG